MELTPIQYKALKMYVRYHTASFTVGQVLRSSWRPWLILAAMAGFCYLCISPVPMACLGMGICLGAFFRDIGHYQVAYRIWPVTEEVIDWKRVDEILQAHEKNVP